jgi:hypothetical protein
MNRDIMSDDGKQKQASASEQPSAVAVREARGLSLLVLTLSAFACFVVGLGAGIGAGYGIFHEDAAPVNASGEAGAKEWLVVLSADNGTVAVHPSGFVGFKADGVRSRAPAFTNVPDRTATLLNTETAYDFIDEGVANDGGVDAFVTFNSGNQSFVFPVVLSEKVNATDDSAIWGAYTSPEYFSEGLNQTTAFAVEDLNLLVLPPDSPSMLDFS